MLVVTVVCLQMCLLIMTISKLTRVENKLQCYCTKVQIRMEALGLLFWITSFVLALFHSKKSCDLSIQVTD